MSEEPLAPLLPRAEEWQQALRNVDEIVNAVVQQITAFIRELAATICRWQTAIARANRHEHIVTHRRRQHARRAEAKASRRAWSGGP